MQILNESSVSIHSLLTIAIPTYNRSNYLDLCLKRIFEEIETLSINNRCLVKVYVSDNASTDETHNVISKYAVKYFDFITIVVNDSNIGGDRNIVQCYESANTPYVWILGDDDVILPGGLGVILSALTLNVVDILYLNHYGFETDFAASPGKTKYDDIKVFKNAEKFAIHTNVLITFISCLIVRTGVIYSGRDELAMSSHLGQLTWALPLIRDGHSFYSIEPYVFAAKGGNSSGYELVKVFGTNFLAIAKEILKNKPRLFEIMQNGIIVNFFPHYILEFRRGISRFDDKDIDAELGRLFCENWRYYFFVYPLIKLPIYLAIFYSFFLRVFRRIFKSLLI